MAIQRPNERVAADGVGVYPEARTKDRFALVLIKNEGLVWNTYFVERRRGNDEVYPGRLGLFGGLIEDGETALECAVREVKEETGIVVGQRDLVKLFEFTGENDKGDANEGDVFVCAFRLSRGTSTSKISRYQNLQADNYKRTNDNPGTPVAISARPGYLKNWLNWATLTPQLSYALSADLDRERRADRGA